MRRPYGSIVVYGPDRRRLRELGPHGAATMEIQRDAAGRFREAWAPSVDGTMVGILAGGADHPLWGRSDRIVGPDREVLSVCGAVDWDRVAMIPPLADPTRLPPGAGTTLLNVLASLASDQGAGPLRYRGPYPTEQLFWALLESFRVDAAATDPLAVFTEGAEAALATGELREAPLDWTPAPHERVFGPDGLSVQLRDGVEKLWWEGRTYYQREWQGIGRREHRVIRRVTRPEGELRYVASLEALGRPLEEHLVLDERGAVVERPDPVDLDPQGDVPLAAAWREPLGELLRLEATPLLATAIEAVWPAFDVVWGSVSRDLINARGERLRLSRALARAYLAADRDRALAQRLVRDVLGLVGPPVRRAAAAWLEAEPADRREALLDHAARLDRAARAARVAASLARLIDALVAGEAVPSP